MEEIHALDPPEQVAFLEHRFARYRGRYDIGL
jgi:hypothetical protein